MKFITSNVIAMLSSGTDFLPEEKCLLAMLPKSSKWLIFIQKSYGPNSYINVCSILTGYG